MVEGMTEQVAEEFGGALLHRVPRQLRSREKVAQAIVAAEHLLDTEGPQALTLTRVAREAGISAGALHQYLPDRDAIVRALRTRYHARFEHQLREIVERPAASDDPVAEVIGPFTDIYRHSAGVRALGGGQDPESRDHKARMAGLLTQLLQQRGVLKSVPDAEASSVARTLFSVADALLHEAFREDPGGDPRLLSELDRVLRRYLRMDAGGR